VDFGVGIESGLFDVFGVELDIQVCSVFDGARHTIGTSPGFTYPISACSIKLQQDEKSATLWSSFPE